MNGRRGSCKATNVFHQPTIDMTKGGRNSWLMIIRNTGSSTHETQDELNCIALLVYMRGMNWGVCLPEGSFHY
jgi:hypothetical protein